MPEAPFACVACKVQGWESVRLKVIFPGPAGAVFLMGCREVSPGDPGARGWDILPWEGCSFGLWRIDVEELRESFPGFRAFPLATKMIEAHICPRIDDIHPARGIALREGPCSS